MNTNLFHPMTEEEARKNNGIEGCYVHRDLIMDKRLSIRDAIWLSIYIDNGESLADENYNAIFNKQTLSRTKRKLRKLGLLKIKPLTPEEIKKLVIEKSHSGYKCEWCGNECYTLHEHHYPISKKDGGKKTVKICPNCHYTYHALERQNNFDI